MIGVLSREGQEPAVEEFFELFKTPWEYCGNEGRYDVVIATDPGGPIPPSKLLIGYWPGITSFDRDHAIEPVSAGGDVDLSFGETHVPVYGASATFPDAAEPPLFGGTGSRAGIALALPGRKVLRLGYDLFDEVDFLLRRGQPAGKARVPTLELHISMLRKWILDAGIPLAEIPPSPYGCDFITCLTHDVDFMGIRDHLFDHTMFGFVYRSLVPKYLSGLDRKTSRARYLKNLRALFSLPLVHAGIVPDFWYPPDRYAALEKELKSSFFFLPFRDRPGESPDGNPRKYRAARYDLRRHRERIRAMAGEGIEVGLHGIDAWNDSRKGREELDAIRDITGKDRIGTRMHWLYFSDDTPKRLEEAGVRYDSTLGYNDAVGFRSGTSQVFRLPGASNVFELPLNVQDTAMLYPDRMNLSEGEAFARCSELIRALRTHGGVFTINWHDRSLAPERNWDALYLRLLKALREGNTWFATSGEAVSWFEKRRAARFGRADARGVLPEVTVAWYEAQDGPPLTLRLHLPSGSAEEKEGSPISRIDRPLNPRAESVPAG